MSETAFGALSKEQMEEARKIAHAAFLEKEKEFLSTAKGYDKARYNATPKKFKKNWLKCYYGQASRMQAIKLFCKECYGYSNLDQIKECPSTGCPLWHFRPQ